jgi:ankyrin repeat protein
LLIEKGANVNAVNCIQETALMWATINGMTNIVKLLIEKGANVNAVNSSGNTALTLGVAFGKTEIIKILKGK